MPKSEGIYFFSGLDVTLFKQLFTPSYAMLLPGVPAMDFPLAGLADASLLALQYWFLLTGFVLAAWWLLRRLVPPILLWPFLALATAMPELDKRILNAQGDWPLDIFFALAALCLARWVLTRETW